MNTLETTDKFMDTMSKELCRQIDLDQMKLKEFRKRYNLSQTEFCHLMVPPMQQTYLSKLEKHGAEKMTNTTRERILAAMRLAENSRMDNEQ